MSYDYKAHFGEVTLTQDLMVRSDDRRWRLTPPPAAGEHHDIEVELPAAIRAFNRDEALRTCKACGAVLPVPEGA